MKVANTANNSQSTENGPRPFGSKFNLIRTTPMYRYCLYKAPSLHQKSITNWLRRATNLRKQSRPVHRHNIAHAYHSRSVQTILFITRFMLT